MAPLHFTSDQDTMRGVLRLHLHIKYQHTYQG